jgi:membrane protein YqaA with SNARE-associated domain
MEESQLLPKQTCLEKIKNNWPRILGILFVVGLSIYIYDIRDQAKQFAQYGYGGIFLFSFLANATIFLPAPSLLFVFAMSGIFHPIGVAIAASLGATLGETTSYIAGFSGNAVIDNMQTYRKLSDWMIHHKKFIGFFILLLAFVPFP